MEYLPLFAELHGRPCLVVGAGDVARRRVELLRRAGARITVQAPDVDPRLQQLSDAGEITLERREFTEAGLDQYWLIIAATNKPAVNAAVANAAEQAMRFCNVVDAPELCSFIMPAIIDRDPVTIAVSTSGDSPVLARWLKALIETMVPGRIGEFAQFLRSRRPDVAARIPDGTQRRRFWESVIDSVVARHAYSGRTDARDEHFERMLADPQADQESRGEAWFVGAGPGDPELISLRGRQLLARADVVLYDRLVSPGVLEFARRDAEFISVGKKGGGDSTPQEEIDRLLVELVAAGKRVCRLKGGDPMVFARLAEELEALRAAGLDYQIVPGVSAVAGCAAYAGIPLTWRGASQSVLMTTGHARVGGETDLGANPRQRTVALYMAAARHAGTAKQLMDLGHDAATPVAIIEHGTLPNQTVTRTTLADLADNSVEMKIGSPALLIVGDVVEAARGLAWFRPDAAGADSHN